MSESPLRAVPETRVRTLNDAPVSAKGEYVLYWMTSARRSRFNYALDLAVAYAKALNKPLVVLEALRSGYEWASDRFHAFVLQGMRANAEAFADIDGVLYYPYVEPVADAGMGLLERLADDACVVIADDWPCFFHPRMLASAAQQVSVALHAVDSNGLHPVREGGKAFARAHDFRRHLQRTLPEHLQSPPKRNALARVKLPHLAGLSPDVTRRWPRAGDVLLEALPTVLARLPIDHAVAPTALHGGAASGRRRLKGFLDERLAHYGDNRNDVDVSATSGLSPYLHFGHVGAHEVLAALAEREGWSADTLQPASHGKRAGWWGMSEAAEGFADQFVTWREVGLNACVYLPDYTSYDSLPAWARTTLAEHADDPRPDLYTQEQLENAETHDELWNAAQNQLRREGLIHNYLRMLWGKKILQWSATPREASETMVRLNDRYALDGRDPNSYSGIFWVLGRYDRAWGPERPIFGKIRYMASENTRRKMRVDAYVERWGGEGRQLGLFNTDRKQPSSSG